MLVLGLDPGGAKAFGWALVSGSFDAPEFVVGGVCSGARFTIAAAQQHLNGQPSAVGIDAPLFWSSVGGRNVDSYVRELVRPVGHTRTVIHVNSLQGACLVEGAIASWLVTER